MGGVVGLRVGRVSCHRRDALVILGRLNMERGVLRVEVCFVLKYLVKSESYWCKRISL